MIKPDITASFVVTLALLLGTGLTTRAQDDDLVDEDKPQAENMIRINRPLYTEDTFNQWVFGSSGGLSQGRKRIDASLNLLMGHLDRTCQLTTEQKQKLRLAGEGDLKRFLNRYEKARQRFQALRNDQNKLGEIFQEIQPLQHEIRVGLFGEGSIFFKTVNSTLDEDQNAKFEKLLRERRWFRYRAKINLVVASLDNAIGFSAEQRAQFVKLLTEETEAPLKFGQWDHFAVLYQASHLPEDKLKQIFDPVQWRVLQLQIRQAKAMAKLLEDGGFVTKPGKKNDAAAQAKIKPSLEATQ